MSEKDAPSHAITCTDETYEPAECPCNGISAEQVIAALSMPFAPGPWFPWEQPRSVDMSDDLADWLDSRVHDTFVFWRGPQAIVRSDQDDGSVLFDKVWI